MYAINSRGKQNCYALNHLTPTLQGSNSKIDNAVGKFLTSKNIKWGSHLAASIFRFADSYDLLEIRYNVDPVKYGFQDYRRTRWADSPWHPYSVGIDPEKKRFIEARKGWMKAAYPIVEQGWKNDLPANVKLPEYRFGLSSNVLTQADMNRDIASVCAQALSTSGDGWAEATFPKSVKIAKSRGFELEKCRSIVSRAKVRATTQPRGVAGQKMRENNTVESKLERVKKMLERGLITEDEAAETRRAILKTM